MKFIALIGALLLHEAYSGGVSGSQTNGCSLSNSRVVVNGGSVLGRQTQSQGGCKTCGLNKLRVSANGATVNLHGNDVTVTSHMGGAKLNCADGKCADRAALHRKGAVAVTNVQGGVGGTTFSQTTFSNGRSVQTHKVVKGGRVIRNADFNHFNGNDDQFFSARALELQRQNAQMDINNQAGDIELIGVNQPATQQIVLLDTK